MMRVFRASTKVVAAAIVGLALRSAALDGHHVPTRAPIRRASTTAPTRAQALLVGAAFAALTSGVRPTIRLDRLRRPWMLQVAGVLGAVVIAVMIVRVDAGGTFLYRGGFLLAAIAAVFFVGAATVDGPVASVLSIKPLVAIGVISYGLYLWHWPIDVVLDETRTGLSGFALFAVRIAVTGAIATASYWLVERPIRRNGLAPLGSWARARVRPAIVAVAAAVVAMLLVVSTEGAAPAPSLAAIAKANQLARRHRDPSKTRILMLGDSQVVSLVFYGVAAFASSGSQYLYKPIIGCGVFDATENVGGNCAGRANVEEPDPHVQPRPLRAPHRRVGDARLHRRRAQVRARHARARAGAGANHRRGDSSAHRAARKSRTARGAVLRRDARRSRDERVIAISRAPSRT